MNVETVIVKMLADASSYNRVMDGVEARLRHFARHAESIGSFISAPFALATQAVLSFTQAMVSAGQAAVQAAINYEDLAIQLEVLAGSADRGQRLMQELMDIAVDTPFKVQDVIAAGKELSAFGVDVDHLGVSIKRLGDISAGTGTPMHRLILAYGQTQIAGRLMGQEMRQFVNANVPLYEYLGKVMDVPVARVKKMIENGQVGADMVTRALNLMTSRGELFEDMMDRLSKTTKGRWNAMVETMEINLAKMGRAFLDGIDAKGIFDELRQDFNSLGTDLETFNTAGANIRAGIRALGDAVLFVKFMMDTATPAVKAWIAENENLGKTIKGGIIAGLEVAAAVGLGLAGTIREIVNAVAKWGRENPQLVKQITTLIVAILSITSAVKLFTLAMTTLIALTGAFKIFALGMSVIGGIGTALGVIAGLVTTIASLSLPLATVLIILADIVFVMDQLGAFKGSMFKMGDGFAEMWTNWKKTFDTAWGGIKDALATGDVELALKIAFKGIEVAFKQMIAALRTEWAQFKLNNFTSHDLSFELAKEMAAFNDWRQGGVGQQRNKLNYEFSRSVKALETIKGLGGIDDNQFTDQYNKLHVQYTKDWAKIGMSEVETLEKMQKEKKAQQQADLTKGFDDGWKKAQQELDALAGSAKKVREQFDSNNRMKSLDGDITTWATGIPGFTTDKIGDAIGLVASQLPMISAEGLGASIIRLLKVSDKSAEARDAVIAGSENWGTAVKEAQSEIKGVTGDFQKMAESVGSATTAIERMSHALGIGPDAKALAEKINQQYMRGVGDETEQFRFFKEQMTLINEANVGVAHGKDLGAVIGGFSGVNVGGGALSDEAANYGMVRQYEKLRQWVGNARTELPQAAYKGTSQAQDIINKQKDRPTTVLEQIQQTLSQAQAMEAQANKYRSEMVDALRKLVPLSTAPAPRKVGFVGVDPKE